MSIRGCIAAGLGISAALAPAEAHAQSFGALAWSDARQVGGYAVDHSSQAAAEASATSSCGGGDCRTVVWFTDSCAAISAASDGKVYYSYSQATQAGAESVANGYCAKDNVGCHTVQWGCTTYISPDAHGHPSSSTGRIGAIAYSDSTGRYGFDVDRASQRDAEANAILKCGVADCRSVVWFASSCAAIAKGQSAQVYYSFDQPDQASAERQAVASCGGIPFGCTALAWSCTTRG